VVLSQTGEYPIEGKVSMHLRVSRPSEFAVRLRIPAWANTESGAGISVNGNRVAAPVSNGFATLERRWKDSDRVELNLPLPMRLEAIDPQNPNTVALVRGPLVLFAATEKAPQVTRQQLLAARRVSGTAAEQSEWHADTNSGPLRLLPFTALEDQRYTTYLNVG
jgi:DUF1680 family protein